MHHIIYLSHATVPFNDGQLQALLEQARTLNAERGITGALLYGNEQFLQVLEGDEAAVRETYARIRGDARHRNVTAYADKDITGRSFPEWSMAYRPTTPEQLAELTSYVLPEQLYLERPGLALADTQLLQLLRTFVLPE